MRPLRATVLAVVLALALPAGAHAQRAWQAPELLSQQVSGSHWSAPWDTALTMTSQGEAIATYVEGTDRTTKIVTRSPQGASSGPESLVTSTGAPSVTLASDALGNAYMAYIAPDNSIRFRVRPPGGSFGPDEVIPDSGGALPRLVVSPDGDVAALWSNGGFNARFRPAGGTFGPWEPLLSYEQGGGGVAAAYSANGDFVLGATTSFYSEQPSHYRSVAYGVVRTPDGNVTVKQVSDGTRNARGASIGVDDSGRAVLAWAEQPNSRENTLTGALVSQRPSGGDFGAPAALSRAGGYAPLPTVVTGRDGLFTIAYAARHGVRVATGRTGETPRHLRSYYDNGSGDSTRLAGSPSGNHALLLHYVNSGNPATSLRAGDAPFASSLDLRNDCGGVDYARLAVGDGGQGAALVQKDQRMLLITDTGGTGTRDCVPDYFPEYNPSAYDDDPYKPRTRGEAGAGAWHFEEESGGGWGPIAGPLPVGNPTIVAARAGQRKRKARVVVVCGKPCTISARALIGFDRGRTLVKGATRTSSKGKAKLVEVPLTLSASAAKTIDAALKGHADRTLLLKITVSVTAPKQKKQTREVVTALALGRPAAQSR